MVVECRLNVERNGKVIKMEVTKKSVVPVYAFTAVWVIYCTVFPLFYTWHYIVLTCVSVLTYLIFSSIFKGTVEYIEIPAEPVRTGDELVDALLTEGEAAITEMTGISKEIQDEEIKQKADQIISVTERIFNYLHDDKDTYKRIKKFSEYFLPTTIKLLHSYNKITTGGVVGDNSINTINRIDLALDTVYSSYMNFYDSLFQNQALDIETDISVLETMLKQEGLIN